MGYGAVRFLVAGVLAAGLLGSSEAAAQWNVYGSWDIGYSIADGSTDGLHNGAGGVTLAGGSIDASPLLGGAFGVEVPLDQATPWKLPFDWRWPRWNARAEIEAIGLRDYELRSNGAVSDTPMFTEVQSWSLLQNVWLDIPMRGLYRPITRSTAFVMGVRRLPLLKMLLENTEFTGGVGIGLSSVEFETSDNIALGSTTSYNFAWQAGGGFSYRLNDALRLGMGYRYVDPGKANARLSDKEGLGTDLGTFDLSSDVHEFRTSLRLNFYDFRTPWR